MENNGFPTATRTGRNMREKPSGIAEITANQRQGGFGGNFGISGLHPRLAPDAAAHPTCASLLM